MLRLRFATLSMTAVLDFLVMLSAAKHLVFWILAYAHYPFLKDIMS